MIDASARRRGALDRSPMHIQIDPVGGMAGDMFVAAMLDAFPSLETAVQAAMRAAGLPERFRCDLVPHADHALTGKRFPRHRDDVRPLAITRTPISHH